MKTYLVGGAVRDILMGLTPKDRDYVVVGGTPEELIKNGFKPVGAEFPVFLHPDTGEEYALARTERKTGPGYNGFSCQFHPGITLEEDLGRRDLTINAMAVDDSDHVVDPFDGQQDIKNEILRHVNAEAFKEDPVRVLRIARFSARYTYFSVHHTTLALCEEMADNGELNHLTAERVWKEFEKGMMEESPSRMFDFLWGVSALHVILPEVAELTDQPTTVLGNQVTDELTETLWAMNGAADRDAPLEVRFALLLHKLSSEDIEKVCDRLKVPNDCRWLATAFQREAEYLVRASELSADALLNILKRVDAFRRPDRLEWMLTARECLERIWFPMGNLCDQSEVMRLVLQAANAVDCGAIAQAYSDKKQIPAAIHAARVENIESALKLI